jgi:hypothetical protein
MKAQTGPGILLSDKSHRGENREPGKARGSVLKE